MGLDAACMEALGRDMYTCVGSQDWQQEGQAAPTQQATSQGLQLNYTGREIRHRAGGAEETEVGTVRKITYGSSYHFGVRIRPGPLKWHRKISSVQKYPNFVYDQVIKYFFVFLPYLKKYPYTSI